MKTARSHRMRQLTALALAGAAVLFGAAAAADVSAKIGSEFQVNTFTEGSQLHPDVARFPDGHFVVVWQDLEGSPVRVKSRLYEASGAPASGELAVTDRVPASSPRVTALPDGGFVVVWEESKNVKLRRFDREGQPLYPFASPVVVNEPSLQPSYTPDIASNSAGTLAVVWIRPLKNQILLRRLDAAGNPLGASVQVNTFATGLIGPHVAMNDAGSVLVSWGDTGLNKVRARRFDGPSGTWSKEVTIEAPGGSYTAGNVPVLYPEGDGAVVFSDFRSVDIRVFAQQMDAAGALKGVASEIGGPIFFTGLDAAIDAAGNAFVVWVAREGNGSALSARIHGRLLDRSWRPVGGELTVSTGDLAFYDEEPAVAADASGGVVTVWSDVGEVLDYPSLTILPGKDGSEFGVFGQLLDPACVADSEVLCLGAGNRFRVRVSWQIPGGETGVGRSHPITADTGTFWFFSPDNLELMIKVLDGRPVNGHFWVFYGALSDVEYTLTVTDTATGEEKTYHNPPGRMASQADTSAFADTASAPASSLAAAVSTAAAAATDCSATGTALCLQSNRFAVEVTFTDPRNGASGPGQAADLTSDTGAFWFFDSNNLELMIKVLDGRPVNGHFWVFFGALSDVAYTIRVTDTETGEQRTYMNTHGKLTSRADTSAFPVGH